MNETPDIVYGRLLEAAHMNGYTAERACIELEFLLEDERWKKVGNGFSDFKVFVDSVSLEQYKFTIEKRKSLARKFAELGSTQRATAKVLGVSDETVRRDIGKTTNVVTAKNKSLSHKDDETEIATNVASSLNVPPGEIMQAAEKKVAKKEKEAVVEKETEAKRQTANREIKKIANNILVGSFQDQGKNIKDESLSLIFTDPPYAMKDEKDIVAFYNFCGSKLISGASALIYCGQTQLPYLIKYLIPPLRYWWTIACYHSEGKTIMREYGIKANWKPILWLVRETRGDKTNIVDDYVSGGKEKDTHEWQQAESEAEYWIEKLCPENGIVCDPFIGGGTTAVAAERLERKWIGIEIDEITAKKASKRIDDERV